MSERERTLYLGALMGLGAFSIDVILPALKAATAHYGVLEAQGGLLVSLYFLGFALGQLLFGPLADAFGRRPVLLSALLGFLLAGSLTLWAPTFPLLLWARVLQGFFGAAFRVVATAAIRDLYRGEAMARRLSQALFVLLLAPVLAPSLGVALLPLGFRAPFAFPVLLALLVLLWGAWRFGETLPRSGRRPLALKALGEGLLLVLGDRRALLYTLALGALFGVLYAYLSAAALLYGWLGLLGPAFALAFGGTGLLQALANLLNGHTVEGLGLARSLLALLLALAFLPLTALRPSPFGLWLHLSLILFLVTLSFPNAQARALEGLGRVAGLAASFTGFFSTLLASLFATGVGQASRGEPFPFALGLLLLGLLAFLAQRGAEA
ncbi:MFS transporter [Thermus sp.]|uniref:MFS transporter n=1 Tax=Thermus sp. TaxID=275 RepID=UPI00307D91E1